MMNSIGNMARIRRPLKSDINSCGGVRSSIEKAQKISKLLLNWAIKMNFPPSEFGFLKVFIKNLAKKIMVYSEGLIMTAVLSRRR